MEPMTVAILTLILGCAAGAGVTYGISVIKGNTVSKKADKLIEDAKKEAEKQKRDRLLELKEESFKLIKEMKFYKKEN